MDSKIYTPTPHRLEVLSLPGNTKGVLCLQIAPELIKAMYTPRGSTNKLLFPSLGSTTVAPAYNAAVLLTSTDEDTGVQKPSQKATF